MSRHRLQNYLRTYRRRSGFSQEEIAFLLGGISGTKISRYENFIRMPAVSTIFAYEVVFRQPAYELFAGRYHFIRVAVRVRARRMLKKLIASEPQSARSARKLALLQSIVEPERHDRIARA